MANDPAVDEYGSDDTVVVITLDELNWLLVTPETSVVEPPPTLPPPVGAELNALEDIEKTGPLMALAVVMVVDVKEEAL